RQNTGVVETRVLRWSACLFMTPSGPDRSRAQRAVKGGKVSKFRLWPRCSNPTPPPAVARRRREPRRRHPELSLTSGALCAQRRHRRFGLRGAQLGRSKQAFGQTRQLKPVKGFANRVRVGPE